MDDSSLRVFIKIKLQAAPPDLVYYSTAAFPFIELNVRNYGKKQQERFFIFISKFRLELSGQLAPMFSP